MSKLSRSEFNELLTEWKQNFINERGPIRNFYKKEIHGSLCPVNQDEMFKLSSFVIDLINFSEKRKDLYTDEYESLKHKYNFNFSVTKDVNLLSEILNFSKNNKIKSFAHAALKEAQSGNKDPVLFFVSLGDFTQKEKVKDQETSPYVTHDLEHAIFFSDIYDSESADRDQKMLSKEDERSDAWNFDKDHPINKRDFYNKTREISNRFKDDIKLLSKIVNKEDMFISLPDKESNAIKIELAFKDFFDKINYAKAIAIGDIMPSVWAYCISNMKDKHDLDEVNNADISNEHKKIIRYVLENSHDNCMDILNKFLLSQNNRIVFINTWA